MATELGNQTAVLRTIGPDSCLTIDHLSDALPMISRKKLVMATCIMIETGYLERVERGCYQLTDMGKQAQAEGLVIKSGPRGPIPRLKARRKSMTVRLWRSMRMHQKFSINDLLIDSVRDEKTGRDMASRYLRGLEQAGYVFRLQVKAPGTSLTSNGFVRWSLIRDTGPQAPVLRRDGTVFDPNTQEVVQCQIG